MQSVQIKCENRKRVPFYNQVDYCVGTGRMGLALQKEYYEQLKYVQEHTFLIDLKIVFLTIKSIIIK